MKTTKDILEYFNKNNVGSRLIKTIKKNYNELSKELNNEIIEIKIENDKFEDFMKYLENKMFDNNKNELLEQKKTFINIINQYLILEFQNYLNK